MNFNLLLAAVAAASMAVLVSLLTLNLPSSPLSGSRDHLHTAEIVPVTGAVGPESLAFDPHGGGPYAGVADGRILKWEAASRSWVDFGFTSSHRQECVRPFAPEKEHICGRPLGLRFDMKSGDLYIADAYFGLQVLGPAGGLANQVVTEAEGQLLHFTNDMDIEEQEDVIYFTDTSTDFQRRQFMPSILSGDKTGRLIKYNKSSGEVTVLLRGLASANGVALSKDRTFVLVAETTTCGILRYWLKGSRAGHVETFVDLPGFPDNIRRNSKGEFWVALHAKRGLLAHWLVSNPWIGRLLLKLPLSFEQLHFILVGGPHAIAIKVSEEGRVMEIIEDSKGKKMRFVSEVEERDGKLWIGSVMMPFVGVYDLGRESS